VARSIDTETAHLQQVVREAAAHKGGAFIEIYQNCNVFNDEAFAFATDKATKEDVQLRLEAGKPMRYGKAKDRGIRVGSDMRPEVVRVGEGGVPESDLARHDPTNDTLAWMLSRLEPPDFPLPLGVLRKLEAPTYEQIAAARGAEAQAKKGVGDLEKLLHSGDTWLVS
jgi:2-oxoglutarate ferredoxin oxidoreductase subunit beta